MQFKQLIDDITIGLSFSRKFASIENIKRKCNLIVDLSKFTSNKKIFSKTVNFVHELIILSINNK